jgi:hypothetical protein
VSFLMESYQMSERHACRLTSLARSIRRYIRLCDRRRGQSRVARHAKAALMMQLNKTDQGDAYGLAQIVRCGWYREVEVKSIESHRVRLLLTARGRFVSMRTTLYNQIRGLMKTLGLCWGQARGARLSDKSSTTNSSRITKSSAYPATRSLRQLSHLCFQPGRPSRWN